MAMEEQIFHDHHQLPFDSLWSNNCPLQDHPSTQTLSSSSHFIGERPKIYNYNNNNHQTDQEEQELAKEELGAMKEMMFKIAAMQPVDIDPATIRKPKRCNVRLSDDPQSVAARKRREKISEKIRILQRLVPGGTKMDTASMLEEAGRYIKFLKRQVRQLQGSEHHQSQCIGSAGEWPETRRKQQLHVVSTTLSSMGQITYNLGPRKCGL